MKPKNNNSLERKRKAKTMFLSFSFQKTKENFEVTKKTTKFQR